MVALREERRRLDEEEQRMLRAMDPQQMELEERVRALKRPRCPAVPCTSDCALDHRVNDNEPIQTVARSSGLERVPRFPRITLLF